MKKATAVLFLVVIFVLCAVSAGTVLRSGALSDVFLDVAEKYGGGVHGRFLTVLDASVRTQIETVLGDNTFPHDRWMDLYGLIQRLSGVDVLAEPSQDKVVYRLKNGSIAFNIVCEPSFSEAELDGIREIKSAADAVGAQSVHFLIARDVCPDDPDYAARGVLDYSAEQNAYYAETLHGLGFRSVDLHRLMHEAGMNHADMYFRTDHHWKVQMGLWAAGQVAKTLGLPTDLLDPSLYTTETYINCFLGTEGKRCGSLYCGKDDFELLLPTFQTELTLEQENTDGTFTRRSGDFDRALMFRDHLTGNTYTDSMYPTFLDGDCTWSIIENRLCPDGAYVLFCKDSYTRNLAPFLALVCRRVDLIDPRFYKDSVAEYIRENRPDYVCITATAHMGEQYYTPLQTGEE